MMDEEEFFIDNEYDIQYGMSVSSMNVNGISSSKEKRMQLNLWMHKNEIDIMCIQEWYKHHNDTTDLDITDFIDYNAHITNSKTLILYKNNLNIDKINLDINENGLDITWVALINKNEVICIGSIYHSPSFECSYDELSSHINKLKKKYVNKKIYFSINGDLNAKDKLWTSSNNKRGDQLSEWIDKENMVIKNNNQYTFINFKTYKKDIIDLSIASKNLSNIYSNWYVDYELYEEFKFSDHMAFIYELDFNPLIDKAVVRYTWNFNVNKEREYKNKISEYMEKWKIYFERFKNIKSYWDKLVNLFESYIFNAAAESFGIKKYSNNSILKVSTRERYLHKKRKKLQKQLDNNRKNKFKFFGNKIIKKKEKFIKKLRKQIRNIRERNIQKNTQIIEERINDAAIDKQKEFYKLYDSTKKTSEIKIGPLKDKNDNIIATSKEEIANTLLKHFNAPLKQNEYNENHIKHHNKVSEFMNNYQFNRNNSNSVLNRLWTNQEVMKIINNLNLNSAMAHDMIHYKLIFIARHELINNLVCLFNYVYCIHAICPFVWKFGSIKPIPKAGRPPVYNKNIRPITKLPGLGRTLQSGVNFRMIYVCIKKGIIRPGNVSFQPNKMTEDIMLRQTENIYKAMQNKSFIELTFMDLKSAYDSVWVEGFFYKCIVFYDFDGCFIEFEYNYLFIRYNRVEFEGVFTKWTISRKCLAQGDPSSTIFFNIYMNDFKCKNKRIEFNNFADDSTLNMISNENMNVIIDINETIDLRKSMENEIENFRQWTLNWKLIISYQKCNTITFSRKSNKFTAYIYQLQGNKLECIHATEHAPPYCIHNPKQNYHNHKLLDNNNNNSNNYDHNGSEDLSNYRLNSISGKYEKIDNSDNSWKNYRMKKGESMNLTKYVRILGLMFDPKLFWNEHVNILIEKCKFRLHQLRKIAYCKYYKFNANTIWKLWLSVIKPKIMYGICTYSSVNDTCFNKLEALQLEAARIALRVKKQTPRIYLYKMLNIKSIKDSLKQVQIKLWHRYLYAPKSMIINKTFNEWKQYIMNNQENINKRITRSMKNNNNNNSECELNLDIKRFNIISKSPLSRAYLLMKELNEMKDEYERDDLFTHRIPQVVRAPPVYGIPFPCNVESICSNNEFSPALQKSYIFYSDGSCKPNPGPGSGAYYSPNFIIKSKLIPIMHDTTINYAELSSIGLIIESIKTFYCKSNIIRRNITIYTDSLFCCNLFTLSGYAKFNYYYNLLQKIFKNMNYLFDNFGIKIKIIKIKSHSNNKGNDLADKLAKNGADIAIYEKEKFYKNEKSLWDPKNNSIMFQNQIFIKKLNNYIKNNENENWKEFFKDPSQGYHKFYNEFLFLRMMRYGKNGNDFNSNCYKYLINEIKYLNAEETSIINKLRTENINLNNFIYFYFKNNNKSNHNNGNCNGLCSTNETVSHFLLECLKFKKQRNILFKKLRKINIKFKFRNNIKSIDILFPHIWQAHPNIDDEDYKIKNYKNLLIRVQILKEVCNFVKSTERFNGDYGE